MSSDASPKRKSAPRKKTAPTVKQATKGGDYVSQSVSPQAYSRAIGVDVSQYQRTVEWKRVAAGGYSFAFIRALDPMFQMNWTSAKEVGILRGAYYVFDYKADPGSQADKFIKTILTANDNGELPPVLDLEPIDLKSATEPAARVKFWLDRVEEAFGKKPIIYSNTINLNNILDEDGTPPTWLGDYPLWLAQYPSTYADEMQPSLPRGQNNWTFWQFTDVGQVEGISTKADINVFNGTLEELRQFAISGVNTAQPEKRRLNFALNDRPQGPDRLSYEKYAEAFAQMLSGQYTQTPLTLGIYASWGMGKSFLLGKIKERLQSIENTSEHLNFAFIEFNAWVYSGSENLWAGLVTKLYEGIETYYETKDSGKIMKKYRRREAWRQLWNSLVKPLSFALVFAVPAIALSIIKDYQSIQENWKNLVDIILLIIGGSPFLAKLPDLMKGVKSFVDSLVLLRSKELAEMSSRKDFRNKVGFMAEIQDELRQISDSIKKLDKLRDQKTRFVIFVDDLDRCPPEKAVEVLEAIMLLLSDRTEDPFIIFLAMDARVLVKAVEKRYGEVLTEAGISGYEFLDKIVQIPFRIPPANDDAIKNYVNSLLYQSYEAQKKDEQPADLEQPAGTETPSNVDVNIENQVRDVDKTPPTPTQPDVRKDAESSADTAPPAEEEPFTQAEKDAFASFSNYISRNPRRVKRIVNIYRLARILLSSGIDPQKVIKWVILTEQWPFRLAWIMQKIEDDIQLGREISMNAVLAEAFAEVRRFVEDEKSHHLIILDEDAETFEIFINQEPLITVEEVHTLWNVTFNLNPAMQNEVLKSTLQNESLATLN